MHNFIFWLTNFSLTQILLNRRRWLLKIAINTMWEQRMCELIGLLDHNQNNVLVATVIKKPNELCDAYLSPTK